MHADLSHISLILIVALAAILRLYALGTVPHGFTNDEAQDGLSARQAIDQGLRVFYPENNGREGLYINLSTALVLTLGNTILAMRLPSAIFGILTVWITYLLGVELFNRRIGLLAAFFVGASTWHLYNSRLTNRANLAPFFLAMTLYLLFHTAKRVYLRRPYLRRALLVGIVYGLGFHTYTSFRVTPLLILPVCVYYLVAGRAERLWREAGVAAATFAVAAAITIAPLAFYFHQHPDLLLKRTAQVSVWSQPDSAALVVRNSLAVAQMFFVHGDTDWKNNISDRGELFLPVAILFALGAGIALQTVFRGFRGRGRMELACALILGWIAVGALPSILTVDRIHALRASLMIPPVFLLAALAADRSYSWLEQKAHRSVRIALVVFFLGAVCIEPIHTYFRNWATDPHVAHDFEDWLVDEATEIRDAPGEPPKYVAIPRPVFRLPEVPQVILYLTQTSTAADRKKANLYYLLPARNITMPAWQFCQRVKADYPQAQVFCVARNLPLRP